jgi:hypothetical protein
MKLNSELQKAIIAGNIDQVNSLLEAKAEINSQDPQTGQTPLMCAVFYRHISVIKLICDQKPDKQLTDFRGKNVFSYCDQLKKREQSLGELVESILNPKTTNIEDKYLYLTVLADQQRKTDKIQIELFKVKDQKEIKLYKEPIKIRAFKKLVKNGLSEAFSVAQAIEDQRMQKCPDSVDKAVQMIIAAAPAIEEVAKVKGLGMGISAVGLFIQIYKRKREKAQASHVVNAFINDNTLIDDSKLQEVSNALAKRYYNQIMLLKISVKMEKNVEVSNPRPGDSIFILAKAIVKRIIYSIASGENQFYRTSIFSKQEVIPMPIEQRCIMATVCGIDNGEEKVTLVTEMDVTTSWTVSGILDFSGIRVEGVTENKTEFYTRSHTNYKKYGFYLGDKAEAERLGFTLNRSISVSMLSPSSSPVSPQSVPVGFFSQPVSPVSNLNQPLLDKSKKSQESETCCHCSVM